jgi:hypothetical protein
MDASCQVGIVKIQKNLAINIQIIIVVSKKLMSAFGKMENNLFNENIYSPSPDPSSDYDSQWSKREFQLGVHWQF